MGALTAGRLRCRGRSAGNSRGWTCCPLWLGCPQKELSVPAGRGPSPARPVTQAVTCLFPGHARGQLGDQGASVTTECPPEDAFSSALSQVTSEVTPTTGLSAGTLLKTESYACSSRRGKLLWTSDLKVVFVRLNYILGSHLHGLSPHGSNIPALTSPGA